MHKLDRQEMNVKKLCRKENIAPWLVWLSGLSASVRTKELPVQFPVRACAWVVGQVPGGDVCVRGNHTLMFLSLSFPSLPPSLKINF